MDHTQKGKRIPVGMSLVCLRSTKEARVMGVKERESSRRKGPRGDGAFRTWLAFTANGWGDKGRRLK